MVCKTFNNLLTRAGKFLQYEVKIVFSKAIYCRGFENEETSKRGNEETNQGNKNSEQNQDIFNDQLRGKMSSASRYKDYTLLNVARECILQEYVNTKFKAEQVETLTLPRKRLRVDKYQYYYYHCVMSITHKNAYNWRRMSSREGEWLRPFSRELCSPERDSCCRG